MKNLKLLFLVALFCGFALNSNAQSDTRAFTNNWSIWFMCDGVPDLIVGTMHGHVVDHYNPKTGVFEWYKFNFFGDNFVSQGTGEVFSISFYRKGKTDMDFGNPPASNYTTTRFNLRGNQGSHILGKIVWTWDLPTNTFTMIEQTYKCL